MDFSSMAGYGGVLIGLVGVTVSLFTYLRSRESKEPTCFYRTFKVIQKLSSGHDSHVRIYYKDRQAEQVFTTYVWFWNNGRKPIRNTDIPPEAEITLHLTNENGSVQILDHKIVHFSRSAIKFNVVKLDEDRLKVDFNFLDHNDGAVIEVQHTGDNETDVKIDGVFLGAPKGISVWNDKQFKLGRVSHFSNFIRKMNPLFLDRASRPRRFSGRTISQRIFALIFPILFGSFILFMFNDITSGNYIRVHREKFEQVVMSELPNTPPETIEHITQQLTERATWENAFFYAYFGFIGLIILIGTVGMWRNPYPFPKALYFDVEPESKSL